MLGPLPGNGGGPFACDGDASAGRVGVVCLWPMSKLDNLQRLDLLGLTPQNQAAPMVRLKLDEDESAHGWPPELRDRFL